jgi:hypothetical protein
MKFTETDAITQVTIERDATAEELQQMEIDAAEKAKNESEAALKAQAKAALLERLGITEDEAKLLLA